MKILSFLKLFLRQWGALLLGALIFAMVIFLPDLLTVNRLGANGFFGIYPLLSDDEGHYTAMAQDVYDGHYNLGNPYLAEYAKQPYLQPPFAEIIYSLEGKIFKLSIPEVFIFNDLVLPFINFILLYFLFFGLTKAKKTSLGLTAIFFLLFLSDFNRPTNPQLSFILLLGGLNFIWLALSRESRVGSAIIFNLMVGIFFGVLFYIYPFYWMTLGTVYSLAAFFLWVVKERRVVYFLKNYLVFLFAGVVIALPYLINYWHTAHNIFFAESFPRFGFIATHIPASFLNIALMLFLLPIAYNLRRTFNHQPAVGALILTLPAVGVILNWQNIVTGQITQFSCHFYPIMVLFIFLIAAVSLRFYSSVPSERLRDCLIKIFGYGLLVLVCIFIIYRQRLEAVEAVKKIINPPDISQAQSLAPVARWLNVYTKPDSVIYTIDIPEWFIPIYTKNYVYFNSYIGFTLMPDQELEERWLIYNFFNPQINQSVIANNREIWANKYIDAYQNQLVQQKIISWFTGRPVSIGTVVPPKTVDDILVRYHNLKNQSFERALKTYRVNYLLLNVSNADYASLAEVFNQYQFLQKRATINNFIIYQIN